MIRIAIIGAGSLSLGKRLIDEILQEIRGIDLELRLMSLHEEYLRLMANYARRTHSINDCELRIKISRDCRESIAGADVVISVFDIGGLRAAEFDYDIAKEFGIEQCIGDTLGPGAVMRSQRVIPVMDKLRQDLVELAPDCLLINYVNPLGPVGLALAEKGWHKNIGMCGGPASMIAAIGKLLSEEEFDYRLAGTNHMSWLTSLTDGQGRNLYPEFKRMILSADIAGKERARAEILQTFGYFCSESSGQLTDMLPWFRNSGGSIDSYLGPGYAGETGAYLKVIRFLHRQLGNMDFLEHAEPDFIDKTDASLTRIIRNHIGLEHNDSSQAVFGNVVNSIKQIKNMPSTAFVESTLKPEDGCWVPEHQISIPEEVLPLSRRHNENNHLMTFSALSGDVEALVRTMCLDPLVSSNMGINSIRSMTHQYLKSEKEWLPQYILPKQFQGVDIGPLPRIYSTVFDGESFVETVRRWNRR